MTISETLPSPSATAFAVYRHEGRYALLAARPVAPGDRILELAGDVHATPTRESVQIGFGRHVDAPPHTSLEERMDRYPYLFLNHSCAPNARIDGRYLIAVTAIATGAEVTFDYETNEYDLAAPFGCGCGAPSCRSRIRGYRHLSLEDKARLLAHTATHLISQTDDHS